jgi:hypothetical protein
MSSKRLIKLPVYRKALELQAMSQAIALCVARRPDVPALYASENLRDQVAGSLLTDSLLIPEQIALAMNTRSLAIREHSLHFIQVMTRNLASYCKGLEMDGVREKEYLDLLRQELRLFRHSFRNWRKSLGY